MEKSSRLTGRADSVANDSRITKLATATGWDTRASTSRPLSPEHAELLERLQMQDLARDEFPSKPTSRTPAQRTRILQLLRSCGASGASNIELNGTRFRCGARIFEVRKAGFDIETRPKDEPKFRFVLVAEPEKPKSTLNFREGRRREEAEAMPLFAGGAA